MRQRASPCAYPHGDTGEGNDAHDAERNLFLSMRGYVTKDLSTETGHPRASSVRRGASPAFLPAPAFPPTVPILLEGRAAFPPHAKRGGSRQPAHIPPSKQKTL